MENVKEYIEQALSILPNPKKSLGQNFLFDESALTFLSQIENEPTLEIGGGLGNLSHYLKERSDDLNVVELDKTLFKFLSEQFVNDKNVKIINDDILKIDISSYEQIVGSLPYYITSDILAKLLTESHAKRINIMIQVDAYKRIFAKFLHPDFNPLSVLLTFLVVKKETKIVSRRYFIPQPHVDSIIINMHLDYEKLKDVDIKQFYLFVKKCFMNPHKTILNNLSFVTHLEKSALEKILKEIDIDVSKRPAAIEAKSYLTLYQSIIKSI